jgi:hypothetical protein
LPFTHFGRKKVGNLSRQAMFAPNTPVTHHAGYHDVGDHVHAIGVENDSVTPVTGFDWNAVESLPPSGTSIPVDQAVERFGALLDWLWCDHATAAFKLAALRCLLDPVQGEFRSLAAIAREANLSRAAVSGWISELRDQFGLRMNFRGSNVGRNCRAAQLAAVASGTHAARKTKGNPRGLSYNQDHRMNQKEIRQKFRTLDAAVTEIERLSKTQSPAPAQSPPGTTTAASPKIVVSPRPTQKPPSVTLSPSPSPPKLADLTARELTEVMDVAHRAGNQQLVQEAYAELNERRRPI